MEGGRVDIWEWDMTFAVINNEHSSNALAKLPWKANINRMRLVDEDDGSANEVSADEDGYIEIRLDRDFEVEDQKGEVIHELKNGATVYIEGTESTPTVNGNWNIKGVNKSNRTFIVHKPVGNQYNENSVQQHANNAGSSGDLQWNEANFNASSEGVVVWRFNS